jgi:hypothetical protein
MMRKIAYMHSANAMLLLWVNRLNVTYYKHVTYACLHAPLHASKHTHVWLHKIRLWSALTAWTYHKPNRIEYVRPSDQVPNVPAEKSDVHRLHADGHGAQ